jgi:hypothetical protein
MVGTGVLPLLVMDFDLPFNVIISQSTLYRFMAVMHYWFLVLNILAPNCIITICGDCTAASVAIES